MNGFRGRHNVRSPVLSAGIVVTTKARPLLLARCLEHLLRLSPPCRDIVVADNDPEGQEGREVAAQYGVSYCVVKERGLSCARNAGAELLHSDVVVFIDDDMVPHQEWFRELLNEFSDDSLAAVAWPVLPMALRDAPPEDLRNWMRRWPRGPTPFKVDRQSGSWLEKACFGGIVQGTMGFRRAAFDLIGGFEEQLGRGRVINHSEEHYAFFRLIESGFRVAYTPEAMVFHLDPTRGESDVVEEVALGAAYFCFLAWRHPHYLPRIARYCVQAILGTQRMWRIPGASKLPRLPLSRWKMVRASLRGPGIFIRALKRAR